MEIMPQIARLGRAAEERAKFALARCEQEPTNANMEMLTRAVAEWERALGAWSAILSMDVAVNA
jgi:hypothetical protein